MFRQKKYNIWTYSKKVTGIVESRSREKKSKYQSKQSLLKANNVDIYEREDNSRIKAGKKYSITRRKIKKQIKLLNDTIKNIHRKYVNENKQVSAIVCSPKWSHFGFYVYQKETVKRVCANYTKILWWRWTNYMTKMYWNTCTECTRKEDST